MLSGTERLEGRCGTLLIRWRGLRSRVVGGRARITGSWEVGEGSGTYGGFHGRGSFAADAGLWSREYRGVLVGAV